MPKALNVVIIDDKKEILSSIQNIVEDIDSDFPQYINTFATTSSEHGLNYIYSTESDVIILDLTLPKLSNREVFEYIDSNDKFKNTKVIFLADNDHPDIKLKHKKVILNKNAENFEELLKNSVILGVNKNKVQTYKDNSSQETESIIESWDKLVTRFQIEFQEADNIVIKALMLFMIIFSSIIITLTVPINESKYEYEEEVVPLPELDNTNPQGDPEIKVLSKLALGLTITLVAGVVMMFNSMPTQERSTDDVIYENEQSVLGVTNDDSLENTFVTNIEYVAFEPFQLDVEVKPISNNLDQSVKSFDLVYQIDDYNDFWYYSTYNGEREVESSNIQPDLRMNGEDLILILETEQIQIQGRLLVKICVEADCENFIVDRGERIVFRGQIVPLEEEDNSIVANDEVTFVSETNQTPPEESKNLVERINDSESFRLVEVSTLFIPILLLVITPIVLIGLGSPLKDLHKYLFELLTGDIPKKKEEYSGIIYDGENSRPLPFSTIQVLNKQARLVTETTSDDKGRFFLEVKHAGKYFLKSKVAGYHNFHKKVYIGSTLKVHESIQMERLHSKFGIFEELIFFNKDSILKVMRYVFMLMVIIGFFANLLTVLVFNHILIIGALSLYTIALMIIIFSTFSNFIHSDKGRIVDKKSQNPISNAIVKIFDKENNLIDMVLSNENGEINFNVPTGKYTFKVAKNGYAKITFSQKLDEKARFSKEILLLKH